MVCYVTGYALSAGLGTVHRATGCVRAGRRSVVGREPLHAVCLCVHAIPSHPLTPCAVNELPTLLRRNASLNQERW